MQKAQIIARKNKDKNIHKEKLNKLEFIELTLKELLIIFGNYYTKLRFQK